MARVQISFQDNADNEDGFKIYKSTSSTVANTDTLIATITLASGVWGITGAGSNLLLSSSNNVDNQTTGETFVVSYDEDVIGVYYYGVASYNAIGDSSIIATTSSVNVAS